ncbi:protein of unknown function [Magnetospirillum sp. XM-1]|nr:protein of unknown function [Magnetospirillum sp. XM-1]
MAVIEFAITSLGAVGERLAADLAVFRPLPAAPFEPCDKRPGRVSSLSLVRYRCNDYSVPTQFGHREVLVNPSKEALVALEKEGGYDLAVLAAVGACLLTPSGQSDDGAEIRIAVPATGICAGDVLVSDLTLESGRLVLAAGETISDLLFLRLQNINAMARLKEPIMVRRFASRPRAN